MRNLPTWFLLAATLTGQARDFGKAYAFAERAPESQVEKTIERLLPSLVKVHGASGLATISAYATGVLVSDQGHVLTLDQVMIQKDRTRIVLYDGSVHEARLLPEDPRFGVRLLQFDPHGTTAKLQPLWPPAAADATARNGQFVVSIGNSFRLAEFSEKLSVTFGVVIGRATTAMRYRLSDVKYDGDLILTDACNNPGHFGGGLFALDGRWLGLNLRLLDSKETNTMVSAAIPSRDLLPYLEEHILGKAPAAAVTKNAPVWTGIVLFESAGRASPPAYVDRVVAGSPAAELGLLPDDLIVRVDEFSIRTCKEFREILTRFAPGQQVKLTWKRGTKVLQHDLRLAEEPKK